ncbi:serine hydrolase [Flavobacterium tegetincola]|uniref:serine hydrolase n=1 Tax=Flavobacterium tegetincola TaxID=150172 RepID=UPI00040B6C3E|nr:serine hydrolase [Flavobacterium tegetincola]
MKKTVAILAFMLISAIGFAQADLNVSSFEKFKTNYNSNSYELIFDQFSNEMQTALPLGNTKQFFSGLQSKAGNITDFEVIEVQSENTSVYKTTFEHGFFAIQFSIDAENKIAGLMVNPFVSKSISTVENNLTQYPAAIADLIFANAKDFPENTQLSIAVLKNGKVSYYGVQLRDNKLIPIENQESVFEIGSLTKVFTSTVLANLVVEGKLKLTDKINSYYPFLFKNKATITFKSLANHTSGLPRLPQNLDVSNADNPYKNYGVKELDTYLAHQMILAKADNNTYDYSNLGAGLLGHTLGLSQKKPFTKLVQDVFKKYQMNNSFTTSENLGSALVKGLDEDGNVVYNWNFDVLFGGGGILSTTSDLVRFAEAQFQATNIALELTRKETAVVSDDMKIGMGWHLLKSEKGNDLIWHNGGTGGYSSSMVLDVKNKNGVIILSNVSGLSSKNEHIDTIGFAILEISE